MANENLIDTIKLELPALPCSDQALHRYMLDLTREAYADRRQTDDRFDRTLDELKSDRENQACKWHEQSRKWEESGQRFDRLHEEIMAQAKQFERPIGALGARWGLQSEAASRNAPAGILEQSFGVEVLNVNEYGDQGEVFGRTDQVELDVIVKNDCC